MVKSFASFATSAAILTAVATAASVPDGTWPTSTGTVQYATAHIVKAGEVFDGKMQTFERSDVSCEGQTESGSDTAVFKVEAGGTLKNVIIGKNQMEGVHCDNHDCHRERVVGRCVRGRPEYQGRNRLQCVDCHGWRCSLGRRQGDPAQWLRHRQHRRLLRRGHQQALPVVRHVRRQGEEGVRFERVRREPGQRHRDGEQELGRRGHAEQHLGQVQRGQGEDLPVVAGQRQRRAVDAGRRSVPTAVPVLGERRAHQRRRFAVHRHLVQLDDHDRQRFVHLTKQASSGSTTQGDEKTDDDKKSKKKDGDDN
ncbi:hypothetical protein AM588_10000411 [Phytophthora nicotianae]|uniref:Probable pectate lyase F n=1 Tax=Phytophthora nicotianae TaxID=4792 RepID=A0A0W8CEQ7_PHYNI|nr:hypothetical protein AM588_10000411 [Phytophthora nicotianae]